MKLELKFDYRHFLKKVSYVLSKNKILLSSIVVLIVGVFVIQRINQLTAVEVDQAHKTKRLEEIKRVEFDQASIDAITKLNSSSVEITSDFTNRTNPFSDN